MKKIIISLLLTALLGPGVGHLYLRFFKAAGILIGASLLVVSHMAWRVMQTLPGIEAIQNNPSKILQEFYASNPQLMLFYDVMFAALWAYALVDVYFKSKEIYDREKPPENEQD
ncbi:MAG: hypothetical protein JW803_02750 [Endomicrobiales bacterium]|nr:hypothetical protein [Endomicrobiales bacterium]